MFNLGDEFIDRPMRQCLVELDAVVGCDDKDVPEQAVREQRYLAVAVKRITDGFEHLGDHHDQHGLERRDNLRHFRCRAVGP